MKSSRGSKEKAAAADTDGVLRLHAEGVVAGEVVEELEESFLSALGRSNAPTVVLDLTRVSSLDSRGIAVCIGVLRECQKAGRSFSIEANATIFHMMTMLNLQKAMTIREVAV